MSSPSILAAYGIEHSYGRRRVLDGVSLEMLRGQVTALLGPNASGKSTLLKVMAGILSVQSGQVRFLGSNFSGFSPAARARSVAFIGPELNAQFPLSAYDAVMMGRICHASTVLRLASAEDRDAVEWAMEQCNCWGLRARSLQTLSGGERELVALARGLAQGARVLLLDEALSRMDLHHQALAGRLLRKLAADGFAVLLVSHDVNLALEWSDNCALLKGGSIVGHGPTRETLSSDHIRSLYPGGALTVGRNPFTGAPMVFFGQPGTP